MKNEQIDIKGMSCIHCVSAVKRELAKLDISESEVTIGKAAVRYDETVVSHEQIIAAIKEAGYHVV